MPTPRISYARSTDGVTLAYTVSGQGPALVFVPWVPFSNLRMEWENPLIRPVYDHLASRLTLVHYDGRGTGHSQRDVTDLSLDAMLSDLGAVVDRVGLGEFSLLGQYNSCPHALAFAARHPERVKRIALFGGSARGWNAMSATETQALLSLMERDWDVFADTAAHQWIGWSAGEAGRAVADGFRSAVTPQTARATMQAASGVDVTDELAAVRAPTLVLHRRDATQIPLEVSEELAADLPDGHLLVLDGSQPNLFLENPDAVMRILIDFISAGTVPSHGPPTLPSRGVNHRASIPNGLSPREVDVLRLLAAGESNSEIARRLHLSPHTVERHVANIYRKIDARGRADATAFALRHGLA